MPVRAGGPLKANHRGGFRQVDDAWCPWEAGSDSRAAVRATLEEPTAKRSRSGAYYIIQRRQRSSAWWFAGDGGTAARAASFSTPAANLRTSMAPLWWLERKTEIVVRRRRCGLGKAGGHLGAAPPAETNLRGSCTRPRCSTGGGDPPSWFLNDQGQRGARLGAQGHRSPADASSGKLVASWTGGSGSPHQFHAGRPGQAA